MLMNINSPNQIGAILASRRKLLGLSQADVAARVGLSQNRLSVLEKDAATLNARQLVALLNALGLDLAINDRGTPGKSRAEW
jgi:HTH-type transcriptional regulator/antitoxin HipB